MKRKFVLVLASCGLLALPTCINLDQSGLLNLGSDLACGVLTSGLPFSGQVDYCSVVDLDLGAIVNEG